MPMANARDISRYTFHMYVLFYVLSSNLIKINIFGFSQK